jgi:hypothetical protein
MTLKKESKLSVPFLFLFLIGYVYLAGHESRDAQFDPCRKMEVYEIELNRSRKETVANERGGSLQRTLHSSSDFLIL